MIGRAEALTFLRDKPVGFIPGAGAALQARLAKDGITHIAQLQDLKQKELAQRYGNTGLWLHRLSHAEDSRSVEPDGELKSISSETTFGGNIFDYKELEAILWRQTERVSTRAKSSELGGRTVVLKLKTSSLRKSVHGAYRSTRRRNWRIVSFERRARRCARKRAGPHSACLASALVTWHRPATAIRPILSTTAQENAPRPSERWTRCGKSSAAMQSRRAAQLYGDSPATSPCRRGLRWRHTNPACGPGTGPTTRVPLRSRRDRNLRWSDLHLCAELGDDIARRIGNEGRAVKRHFARLSRFPADTVRGDQRHRFAAA